MQYFISTAAVVTQAPLSIAFMCTLSFSFFASINCCTFFGLFLFCAFMQTFYSIILFLCYCCFTVLSHVSSSCLVSFMFYQSCFLFSHISLLSSLPVSFPVCMNIIPTLHFLSPLISPTIFVCFT